LVDITPIAETGIANFKLQICNCQFAIAIGQSGRARFGGESFSACLPFSSYGS
jgi:hypothetical protein